MLRYVRYRTLAGPVIRDANRRLIEAAARRYDIVWMDKATFAAPETVQRLVASGALVVHYNPDNPFGPRNDPGWRLFRAALPHYHAHILPRAVNLAEYQAAGAGRVLVMPFSYEPPLHYPPPAGWSDGDRTSKVTFIGTPHDDRPRFVQALWRRHGIRVDIHGARWRRYLSPVARRRHLLGGPLWGDDYRRAIWQARIVLGFVTRSNNDPNARRWFEIAGCGGFLLGQRTPEASTFFEEGREAVYFSDVDECAAMIRRYVDDEAGRERIAAAGRARAESSGYGNDTRLKRVLAELTA